MKAAVFHGIKDVQLEDIEIPQAGPGEILVKVRTALTCGTDAKTYLRGAGKSYAAAVKIFGHEYAGDVEAVGEGVTQFAPGMRVMSANSAPCHTCYYCKMGRYPLCENLTWLWGTFAEYLVVPAPIVQQNTYEIPDQVGYKEAALTEPLACVLHGIERAEVKMGDAIVINGAGPIGLMYVILARMKGANIIVTDMMPDRLEVAKRLGADHVIQVDQVEDVVQAVKDLTEGGRGVDVAIEAVGKPEIWETTIAMGRKGATISLFGGCPSGTSINVLTERIHYDELRIQGVFHHTPYYVKRAFQMICDNRIPTAELITHEMPLSEVQTALEMITSQQGIKIALIP
ncbi:MAG TPA: zinc-binding dehydrogenase [Candidatus Lokiarchaeia archaeon]|nr:zinc-binding dehydrogenase [Candidatus Lokiarchaeia archaeon]